MKEIIYNNDNLKFSDITSRNVRVKVLLINNGKLLIGNEDGCFMFIGGHQENNEELIDTLKREVEEETGIKLDNEVINGPFLKIIYLNKNYPSKGENRESDIYYYMVETDKLPNLKNTNYTESESKNHFKIEYIDLNDAINVIKKNIPNHENNKIISRDMIIALEEYGRIK